MLTIWANASEWRTAAAARRRASSDEAVPAASPVAGDASAGAGGLGSGAAGRAAAARGGSAPLPLAGAGGATGAAGASFDFLDPNIISQLRYSEEAQWRAPGDVISPGRHALFGQTGVSSSTILPFARRFGQKFPPAFPAPGARRRAERSPPGSGKPATCSREPRCADRPWYRRKRA